MKRIIIPLIIILAFAIGAVLCINIAADTDGASTPELTVTGANLVFSDRTRLIYAVDVKNAPSESVELLIFKGEGTHVKGCLKGKEAAALTTTGETVSEGEICGFVFEYTDLAAAEFTENLYARAYYKDALGNEYYSEVVKYSPLQYACNKLGMTGTATKNEKLRNMLESLLIYCASAQEYFGINTNRLATDQYFKYYLEDATLDDGMTYGLYKKGERITATANVSTSKPYVTWRDGNGTSVSTDTTLSLLADRNRTLVASLQSEKPTFGSYKYVVIIGVDGAGCFYPDDTSTPNIDSIFGKGALTHTMRVTSPSASSVSWMSCLHGVLPENHGNLENSTVESGVPYTMDSKYPSILRVVKEAMPTKEVACFYAWSGINGIVESGAGINKEKLGDAAIVTKLESGYLSMYKPTLTYLHFNNPDAVGHNIGHLTPEYFASIETIDKYVGRIYNAYKSAGMADDTLFILTSDHGGINKTHGGLNDTEKYSLFAVAGKNVTNTTPEDVYIRDTSAVVLHALGIEMPRTYTAQVPTGIFADMTASGERFEYHDPDQPRYHLPEPTPTEGTDGYVTGFTDHELITYLPFDGDTEDVLGRNVIENGKLTYVDGYFGKGIQLEDGYLNIEDFNLGTGSYTISMWVKNSTPTNGYSPIITNKAMSSSQDGFVYAVGRYASVEAQDHYALLNVAKGGHSVSIKENFPKDYIYGWMHVTLVLDRENGLLRLAYDFGEFITVDLPSFFTSTTSLSTAYNYLTIGEAPDGNAAYKSGIAIDELMIFEGAFDERDMRGLVSYFGAEVEMKEKYYVSDAFPDADKPEVYLPFEDNAGNKGTLPVFMNRNGTVTYDGGRIGSSAYIDSRNYVGVDDLALGTDSFSVAMWVYPTSLESQAGRKRIPLISNALGDKRENYGFNLLLDLESEKLVATIGQPGSGVEESVDFPRSTYETKWTHVAAVFDRDSERIIIYIDFKRVLDAPLNYFGTDVKLDPTLSADSGYPIRIGNLGVPVGANSLDSYVDDVMIFKRAITDSDICRMIDYYKRPLTAYIDKTPVIDLGFNGSTENRGTYDGYILEDGKVNYTEGYLGSGATFGEGYVEIPEMTFDASKSFTVSFFMNMDSLSGDDLVIFSSEAPSGGGISVIAKRSTGEIYVSLSSVGDSKAYATVSYDGIMTVGKWMHVAIVVNRSPASGESYLTVYLDFAKRECEGEGLDAIADADFTSPEGYTPHIGADGDGEGDNPYTEKLDELMIFEYALTESELVRIKAYYNQK